VCEKFLLNVRLADFIPAYGGTSDIVYNERAKLTRPFVFQYAQAVTAISN